MAIDYVRLAAVATRLIDESGRDFTLRLASATPADSSKPWAARQADAVATDDQSIAVRGAFFDILSEDEDSPPRHTQRTGRLLVAAAVEVPAGVGPEWYADDGSREWEILSVDRLQPGDVLLLYDIQVAA